MPYSQCSGPKAEALPPYFFHLRGVSATRSPEFKAVMANPEYHQLRAPLTYSYAADVVETGGEVTEERAGGDDDVAVGSGGDSAGGSEFDSGAGAVGGDSEDGTPTVSECTVDEVKGLCPYALQLADMLCPSTFQVHVSTPFPMDSCGV
jgi:hypothetical protein